MAENQEDIIIIEEDLESVDSSSNDDNSKDSTPLENDEQAKQKKLIIIVAIALGVILIIAIAIIFYVKLSKKEKIVPQSTKLIEEKLTKNKLPKIEPSQLENMIAKANYLYANGSKKDALFLYERIAMHSEAISQYNLGVAQIKNEQYSLALQTFKKAIKNDEKRCVSAINAAVCSLHLKDEKSFHYYIDLAHAYLPYELKSPLYSYYYSLVNYYNNNYLEALSALKNTTSNEYPEVQKHLKAKIEASFGNNYDAIDTMTNKLNEFDDFNIALLYARVGDYTLAINHFNEAILKNIEPLKSKLALSFVKIKAGRVADAAKDISEVTAQFSNDVYKPYPIKVDLKKSLFNPRLAQKHFRETVIDSKEMTFQEIFYFSPYKVFNANSTISYIRKGNANIFIDNVKTAQEYLQQSASSSSVNVGIARAIKKALEFKIREANTELNRLVKMQPKHSILHYNLALTYAQMGDMVNAYKHFIRSYHLDAKNYISGVFAILSANLIGKDTTKLKQIVKYALMDEELTEEIELYKVLFNIAENDYIASINWLDTTYKPRPLYIALKMIIAKKLGRLDIAEKTAQKLTFILPHDILPHILYLDIKNNTLEDVEYARAALKYIKTQQFHFLDLYYGPSIVRYFYVQENLITGKLFFLRKQLKKILETQTGDNKDILNTLALASFYDKAFEESYTLYNSIIDELKIRDAYTLFMGAMASTAAGHHENAIALLELSKMKDKNFLEARYALGLLYMEIKNYKGAVIQLSLIDKIGFNSEFLNFDIDTNKLLFQKQHK